MKIRKIRRILIIGMRILSGIKYIYNLLFHKYEKRNPKLLCPMSVKIIFKIF